MKYTTLIVLTLSLIGNQTFGQEEDWRLYKPKTSQEAPAERTRIDRTERVDVRASFQPEQSPGKVLVKCDPRIAEMDSVSKLHPSPLEGYRVQIFFGSRNEAQRIRGEFLKKYPETGAYISYLAPNFRLRVGDFRSKMESEKFKKEIQNDFSGSYIVKDQIGLPQLRQQALHEE